MSVDFVARALSATETGRNRRRHVLQTLARSIAGTGLRLPRLAAVLPTVGAASAASTIAGGVLSSAVAAPQRFTLLGGTWTMAGPAYPSNQVLDVVAMHLGNGTDPLSWPTAQGHRCRFASWAPRLEILVSYGDANGGFRLKVDGEYVHQGLLANGRDGTNAGALRYIPVTWGDGSETARTLRHYELEWSSNGRFGGIVTSPLHTVQPWPAAGGLRMLVHGDSMVSNVVDSASQADALLPATGSTLALLLGQPDCWISGSGGTGWINDNAGQRSTFNERVAIDVVAPRPDVIVEIGGRNDGGLAPQATVRGLVEAWLDTVIGANPDTIIFMTGPIVSRGSLENTTGIQVAIRDAKRDAAARYPRNVAFIDNLAAAWSTGTGNQANPQGDGNADWATGPDGAHPTIEGTWHNASCLAAAIASAIPTLLSRQ